VITVMHLMDADPRHLGEVFHLTLEHDPRGSPAEADWHGARYAANGIKRDKAITILRRLADRLERGESIQEITLP